MEWGKGTGSRAAWRGAQRLGLLAGGKGPDVRGREEEEEKRMLEVVGQG